MSSLRFGMFTTFYPPFNFGGDGIDTERMARALVRRGHRVTVVHDIDAYEWLSGRTLPEQPRDQDGVEVIGLRSRLGVIAPLLTHQFGTPVVHRRFMEKVTRERGFDVLVFGNVSLVGGPGLLTLGEHSVGGGSGSHTRPLRVYLAHEHWLVCPTHVLWRFNREPCDSRDCVRCVLSYRRPPQLWRFTSALERRLSSVDLFLARSEFSRNKHREFGFSRPMEVLPYFLPGDYPTQPPPRTTDSPHSRPYFLTVGRLTRIKGVEAIIPAFRKYQSADLLIAGDGEDRSRLEQLAAGMPNVRFLGRVPNDELRRYYEHAIAAVMPSAGYETFGIVLIEAMRHHVPVLARRIGPFPEIVDQSGGGLLFADGSELLEAMRRLQDNPAESQRLADSGYQRCRERWSEGVVIDRFMSLVQAGLHGRRKEIA
jgi:glycosyltransferase involved in cell wall biosynthesis